MSSVTLLAEVTRESGVHLLALWITQTLEAEGPATYGEAGARCRWQGLSTSLVRTRPSSRPPTHRSPRCGVHSLGRTGAGPAPTQRDHDAFPAWW